MRKWTAVVIALVLVLLLPSASAAVSPSRQSRVIGDFAIALAGETAAVGRVKLDVHSVSQDADIPGAYSFDGNGTGPYAYLVHARGLIQHASFWYWNEQGGARFAFVEGVQCLYLTSEPPVCMDASWALIDYVDPKVPDQHVSCSWDGGVRPTYGNQGALDGEVLVGFETCQPEYNSTTHQGWYDVVGGSLVVTLAK